MSRELLDSHLLDGEVLRKAWFFSCRFRVLVFARYRCRPHGRVSGLLSSRDLFFLLLPRGLLHERALIYLASCRNGWPRRVAQNLSERERHRLPIDLRSEPEDSRGVLSGASRRGYWDCQNTNWDSGELDYFHSRDNDFFFTWRIF